MLRLAVEQADIVALGLPPQSTEDDLAKVVATLPKNSVELHVNVAAVAGSADAVPQWLARMVGGDPQAMAAGGGIAFLLGTPEQIADLLRRRRAELGISYLGVSALFMEQFAPVIKLLRG